MRSTRATVRAPALAHPAVILEQERPVKTDVRPADRAQLEQSFRLSAVSGVARTHVQATPSSLPAHYFAPGSIAAIDVAAALHVGCPQPLTLMPDCWVPSAPPPCGVMSYTMLSGRVGSPLTPAGT